jgi:hypothetical protein
LLGVATASENREARIFWKSEIGKGKLALQERRVAVGLNQARMDAIGAQAGIIWYGCP